ncbi:hypothetical protein [Polyangium spumosum]|uniref:Tetratricopeptide repeat protein n=1 Tax=Polyangium spumosum TaxID=889282 RepID=A0A6N7Q433_9BACT|nr:hypothetical protein [Polyangium spumosum]MRG95661.1 hypothetical protein [Polyangium spumosum]
MALFFAYAAQSSNTHAQAVSVDVLFMEALEAYDAGNYATACPKFEQVVRIKPGLGARVALGHCYRDRGDVVQAIEVYEAIVADAPELEAKATTPKDKDNVKDRAQMAQKNLSALELKVGRLTLEVPSSQLVLPAFVLRLDGAPVPREQIGKPRWILPGKHRIEGSATGFVTDAREVEVQARGAHSVAIELVPKKPAVEAPPVIPAPEKATPPVETKPSPVTSPPHAPSRPQRPEMATPSHGTPTWAWVAGGLGAGALVVGAAFAYQYADTREAAAADCPDQSCARPGLASDYTNRWNRNVALMAGFGSVGVVGIGVFLAGIMGTRQDAPRAATAIRVAPWAGPGEGGMLVHGSF